MDIKGSLLHLVVDKEGRPLWITITSAKGNERGQALILFDRLNIIWGKNNKNMTICEADKGYDAVHLRQSMLNKGYLPLIGLGSRKNFFLVKKKMQKALDEMGTKK